MIPQLKLFGVWAGYDELKIFNDKSKISLLPK